MPVLTQGDFERLTLRVTANGTTPVAVAAKNVTSKTVVGTALLTVGGTPNPSAPNVRVIAGVGIQLTSTASDTSVYNIVIM